MGGGGGSGVVCVYGVRACVKVYVWRARACVRVCVCVCAPRSGSFSAANACLGCITFGQHLDTDSDITV